MQQGHLVGQALDHLAAVQRTEVHGDLDGRIEIDQGAEPARAYAARVAGNGQGARVLVLESQVVTGDLDSRRSDEVGNRTSAALEALLVRCQRRFTVGMTAANGEQAHAA